MTWTQIGITFGYLIFLLCLRQFIPFAICNFKIYFIQVNCYQINVENINMEGRKQLQYSDINVSPTMAMLVKFFACSIKCRIFFFFFSFNVYVFCEHILYFSF